MKESGYTGKLLEEELFSKPDIEKSEEERCNIFKGIKIDFRQFLNKIIKKIQTYEDPSDPEPRFSNDLHAKVAELLELEDYKKLRIYSTIGTYIDRYLGTDAIFEYEFDNNIMVLASLDVTMNKQKGESHKADVVFQWPSSGLDPKEDREEWLKKINEVGTNVFQVLNYYKEKKLKDLNQNIPRSSAPGYSLQGRV
ncbi:MAG: hypothetical protein CO162_00380 [bacterium (Candidatus Ratteibacteria) CG_4_9_14_3_um_filter_41_21]|uniref:Uncharacterized protein n=1 Tax=bacterium (Candidatus Ratteibacteria) CG_4_9_14_3_um_filter_41_21 TaxID=2014289 RepID=A0A2M7YHX4_9BACT|nr:MAG: hypothetical protein COX67_00970 [Candidatus Falkowbacteria bacterium CG_4_10_14_0_2_um_filter_36_22]PJA62573.1 MAG: hypothetical protein CO162_00380 [bacterium (Candidatus Ratteibacteria) CG_4_9_14_3_um_filter_41_21]